MQLHPNVPSLYIIAAQHELSHLSPSAARVLLQRGIRLNAESVDMWTEYVKFELSFVESMRRRWDVLGIDVNGKGKGKAQESGEEMNEGEVEQLQTEADSEGDEAEQARREIMQGAILKSVMSNAVKGSQVFRSVSTSAGLPVYSTTKGFALHVAPRPVVIVPDYPCATFITTRPSPFTPTTSTSNRSHCYKAHCYPQPQCQSRSRKSD